MTKIFNDPKNFGSESLHGLANAYSNYLQVVHGGAVRSTASPDGQVSIVAGGGVGHYPAFTGWIGTGMAHGAVCGNIFSSPAANQVESVVKAADNGGGTILIFGNYAGDVLHFGAARDKLQSEGMDVRIVVVSDDIASNTAENHNDRRGIAGDFYVTKIAGAAAHTGASIDEVERLARKANDHIRTLGVAFTGCTFPGADEPLFTVPEGEFALGLGIHGEPGISVHPMLSADELGALLTKRILVEEPTRSSTGYQGRVAVLVNGLGATKYEEMFVLFNSIKKELHEAQLEIANVIVGEQVTSLDMAGVSLSLMFLDSELENLLEAPADTPAYKSGNIEQSTRRRVVKNTVEKETPVPGSTESAEQALRILQLFESLRVTISDNLDYLGKLDSIAGDGDHGQQMLYGIEGALSAAMPYAKVKAGSASLARALGRGWTEGAGGTSGAAWGTAICAFAERLSDEHALSAADISNAAVNGVRAFRTVGKVRVGDKTMIDATEPFADELDRAIQNGEVLSKAWDQSAKIAMTQAEKTADLVARKGRARTHGDASLGHPDPGAISFALLMNKVAEELRLTE